MMTICLEFRFNIVYFIDLTLQMITNVANSGGVIDQGIRNVNGSYLRKIFAEIF